MGKLDKGRYLNMQYNFLKVVTETRREKRGTQFRTFVDCECVVCGKVVSVQLCHIKSGHTKSCGCTAIGNRTHFKRYHPLYKIWDGVKYRCNNANSNSYSNYGGRGIKVCKKWNDSFELFYNWAIKAGWEMGLQLDRVNNNGNYSPNNCRIVTAKENCRNRRSTVFVFVNGEKIKLSDAIDKGLIIRSKYYKNMEYRKGFLFGDTTA